MRAFRNPKDNGGSLPARQAACAGMTRAPFKIGAGMAQLRVRHACPSPFYLYPLYPPTSTRVRALRSLPVRMTSAGGRQYSVNSARPNGFSRAGGKTLRTLRKNSANSAVKIRKSHVGNPTSEIRSDFRPPTSDFTASCQRIRQGAKKLQSTSGS